MRVRVPGDKSVTQRALIFAALADGECRLSGLLHGGDAGSTAGALRALGASVPSIPQDGRAITVHGVGLHGLRTPESALDLGNSGTGARLLLGVLAGAGVSATVTGDESLRRRPMGRVTTPLERMGAAFEWLEEPGLLPVRVTGGRPLRALDWESPVASAQVKSALLLAGLVSGAFVLVSEPRRSRDHTERMLHLLGVSVVEHATRGRWRVELRDPPPRLPPFDLAVPGDFSSAAFLLAIGALGASSDGEVTVEGVGLNPTRTAFLDVLKRMGARVDVRAEPDGQGAHGRGEPIGEVTVGAAPLRGVEVGPDEAPRLIDELPLVAALGARAEGVTRIRGAAELRVKESDRIAAMSENLRRLGVEVEDFDDGLAVTGSTAPLEGRVQSLGDHRIAMCMAILGSLISSRIEIEGAEATDVSFPGFQATLHHLTAESAGT